MKRQGILRDELSVKHEEQRKHSPSKNPYFAPISNTNINEPEINPEVEEENHVLFVDVQNGNVLCFCKLFILLAVIIDVPS